AVVDPSFAWTDGSWRNPSLARYVIDEIHVGTFTPEGTFAAAARELGSLRDVGITAVEVMPIAQFPGTRNWGYDGVLPYTAHRAYGGIDGFRAFVDTAHGLGMAVILDAVYNHLGPEGNHLRDFGPYFTDRYRTPWGDALNFDGPGSDEVRRYFVENAWWWVEGAHVDALRLDAVHAIVDPSAHPFVQELAETVHARAGAAGRVVHVIAESAANDARVVRPVDAGGLGCDAQWNDDFHHALHALLTGEQLGYYVDFGALDDLARAYTDGYVYEGRYSRFRGRRHGSSSRGLPGSRFVVFAQNHDQVGNRMAGDRLSAGVPPAASRLAAAAVLLSPFVPLVFQGDEYGERAPFPYFVSHSDPRLVDAVRRGRSEEFSGFAWSGEPPDPQSEETFRSAVLARSPSPGADAMRAWYRLLLDVRASVPAFARLDPSACEVSTHPDARTLVVRRCAGCDVGALVLHFGEDAVDVRVPLPAGRWSVLAGEGDGSNVVSDGEATLGLGPWGVLVLRRDP
ncbi:MAG TPA: malto-oligosyltrehalose trehalohydrolase, partial [Acidimicrobiia bacterium]|nr:malto-oligosyltrehalose trehalohydrolase [Acidimicrobiia bacterium]